MKRMTCKSDYFGYEESVLCDGVNIGDAIRRLAAYEDTGLHPEVIGALQKREQDLLQMLSDRSKQLVFSYNDLREIAQALDDGRLPWPLPNDPLTLEQLREMDGEPVYMRYLGGGGEWGLVETMYGYDHVEICLHRGFSSVDGKHGLFSKGVKIYRRKPKETPDV